MHFLDFSEDIVKDTFSRIASNELPSPTNYSICFTIESLHHSFDSIVRDTDTILGEELGSDLIWCQGFSPEQVKQELSIMEKLRSYIKLDTKFHNLLVGLLRNERLSELYQTLRWPGQVMRGLSHAGYQRAAETAHEHKAIAQAVAERDVVKAQRAISKHLHRSEQDLLARLPAQADAYPATEE